VHAEILSTGELTVTCRAAERVTRRLPCRDNTVIHRQLLLLLLLLLLVMITVVMIGLISSSVIFPDSR